MDKHRTNVFLALVMVLLITAAVLAWVTGSSILKSAPSESAEPTSYKSSVGEKKSIDTKQADDEAEDEVLYEWSSVTEDTDTNLNLRVDCTITSTGDSEITIYTEVYLRSYAISTAAHNGTLRICGKEYSFVSQPIECSDNSKQQDTLLYSTTLTVNAEKGETVAVPISVSWYYNGTYNGRQVDRLSLEKTVTVQA